MKASPAFADQRFTSLAAALIAVDNADPIPISDPINNFIGYSAAITSDTIAIPTSDAVRAFKPLGCGTDADPAAVIGYCLTCSRINHTTKTRSSQEQRQEYCNPKHRKPGGDRQRRLVFLVVFFLLLLT